MSRRLGTVSDAASLLCVEKATLYTWRKQHREPEGITSFVVGAGRVVYDLDEVEAYIEARRSAAERVAS